MILTYSGQSRLSAEAIADASDMEISLNRGYQGDVNWGRNVAGTELNPDISNSTNKRVMRELFASHDVPMPKLLTHGNVLYDAREMGITWDYPIVGRPDQHSKGRGYWLCNNIHDIEKALRGTRRKRAATHFMAFVEAEREYRVHIFKGKSIRVSEKVYGEEEDPRTHRKYYTTGRPRYHSVRNVRKAAKKAVEALGLDFGAVDILARGDNNAEVFVLEVNAAPGLGGTMPRLYADVLLRWERGDW